MSERGGVAGTGDRRTARGESAGAAAGDRRTAQVVGPAGAGVEAGAGAGGADSPWAFEIENLHKTFVVRHHGAGTIKRAVLEAFIKHPIERREVLHGINLKIARGETVALIGRNGSGKSTLLGLIARVYRATAGRVIVHGRCAPLLELGAGFVSDLTGAENLELNAAILGIPAKVFRDRFDEIVNFALDTPDLLAKLDVPLRNYSDGMKMRLGFSIALYTDPDSLLIDEVLAVGDEAFQQKCFRRLEEFHREGGAILFVSHDMHRVLQIATRVVWLHNGAIRMDGAPREVVDAYVAAADQPDFGVA